MPVEGLQNVFWQEFVSNPHTGATINKASRCISLLEQKKPKILLWLENQHQVAWTRSQLATWNGRMIEVSGFGFSAADGNKEFAADEAQVDAERCRKLCEEGPSSDAVEALNLLVQQGSYIHKNLIYLVLKRCIAVKDLVVGRRVHALTVQSGYEGDAFLATHLMGLYAAHGRLEEAMGVFTKVPTPSAHNWSTIILAHARHGKAAQAIRLFKQMRRSTTQPDNHVYVAVLIACAAVGNLFEGREVHAHVLANLEKPHIYVQTGLIDMYLKCRSVEDARRVFDDLPDANVVTWNAMFAGYAQQGLGQEALSLYRKMLQHGSPRPNSISFLCLLRACASVGVMALQQGKELHAQIERLQLQGNLALGTSLVNMYAKCGSVVDARRVFDRIAQKSVVTWTAMMAGYTQQGMPQNALSLYCSMQREGLSPDSVTYVCLLQACSGAGLEGLVQGKRLHELIEKNGLQDDVVLSGCLVDMYAKCGTLEDARSVFDRLASRNMLAWNAMIAGYARQGMGQEALVLYSKMQRNTQLAPDSLTFVCLLQACGSIGLEALNDGKQLHAQILEQGLEDDVLLGSSLVSMYGKCGSVEDARRVFEKLPEKSTSVWTAMMAGYVQQGMSEEALILYSRMQLQNLSPPDAVTLTCLLQACASVGTRAVHVGRQLHAQIDAQGLQNEVVLHRSLVCMYIKCGSLNDACCVFDKVPARDSVTCNVMLAGYTQLGMGQKALNLYTKMQQEGVSPDSVTFVCVLHACASVGAAALHQGKELHGGIKDQELQNDAVLGGSLINMYAKCGSIWDARTVFDSLSDKNIVVWNAMISGYVQQGMGQQALILFSGLERDGISPDSITFLCLLQACAITCNLPLGKQLHAKIEEQEKQVDVAVGAALVNMYAKCCSMSNAQQAFDSLPERTPEAWNALIGGYACHGNWEVVFELFDRMRLSGVDPNGITYLIVLKVCSHVGLVDKGRKYFEVMMTECNITPTEEHYTCMTDLVGRAGHLDEALERAKTMPVGPDVGVWHAVLGACLKWNNVEIGQQAFEFAVSLDGKDAASYVLMSNIYARAELWEEAKEMQAKRFRCRAWKKPGQCWTDVAGVVHTFVAGDKKLDESRSMPIQRELYIQQ